MRVLLELDGSIEDFTKRDIQLSWWTVVLDIQKVPLQGSSSVPAVSVLVFYCNVKVKTFDSNDAEVVELVDTPS